MNRVFETKHFSRKELRCHCGGCKFVGMSEKLMLNLEKIRYDYGKPIYISSAYRCPAYNNEVSKTGLYGPHTTGHAVDVKISGTEAYEVLELAFRYDMTGIGVSQHGEGRFLHLDNLLTYPRPNIWSY